MSRKIKSFARFEIEWKRIKKIYLVTMYSYEKTIEKVQEDIQEISTPKDPIYYNEEKMASSSYEMTKHLNKRYPEMLRESLFIRAVSLLELFFGDTIKEISFKTFDPFKSNAEIEYKVSSILSTENIQELKNEIIEKEIRKLNGKGFNEVKSYYNKKFGIDFNNSGINFEGIIEAYEKRNFLVHTGGKADRKHIRRFENSSYTGNGKHVEITNDYFLSILELFFILAEYIANRVDEKWNITELYKNNKRG